MSAHGGPGAARLSGRIHAAFRAVRTYARALPVILIISAVMFFLSSRGWLDSFEHAGLDAFNVLASPQEPSHVVLVGITDDDYREYFANTSPLNPDVLATVIGAIAAGQPRVIGIDIDTSSDVFQRLQVPERWPRLVWGRDATFEGEQMVPGAVLGGRAPRPTDGVGIAAVPQDSDGVVRRSVQMFETRTGAVPGFAFEVVRLACQAGLGEFCKQAAASAGESEETLRLNFSGERYTYSPLSIRYVLKVWQSEAWRRDSPLKDKVVLLGGCYRAARDSYVTPVGAMAGLQIMAQAVESSIAGGIRPINHLVALLLDILAGLTVVVVQHRFRLSVALALILLAIPLLALVGSFLAFHTFAWWIDFAPVTLGVLIHELYHHAREYQRLRTAAELSPVASVAPSRRS